LPGATRGVAALLCGFILETLVVWRGIVFGHETKGRSESEKEMEQTV